MFSPIYICLICPLTEVTVEFITVISTVISMITSIRPPDTSTIVTLELPEMTRSRDSSWSLCCCCGYKKIVVHRK